MRATLTTLLLVACASPEDGARQGHFTSKAKAPVVVDDLTGQPVRDLRITLVGPGWLRVEAPGYGVREAPTTAEEIRVWPLEADDAAVEAWFERRARPPMDSDDPTDPDLTEAARAILLRQAGEDVPPPLLRKQAIELPETVRIYRRGAENDSCQGRVDVIPLEEYVRGVVPHEWIPSWHQQSLRAGAVAARGYVVGWVFRGGKYDCADLDDTTRSQVYRDDRDARADEAVEATRGQVIVRNGEFVTSEYSAENGDPTEFGVDEPLCSGRTRQGHGRGMCQWGTQRWATQRDQDHVWMVEHYFPGATVSRPEPPAPRIATRQRLGRLDDQPCADPEGTYDCADFVREGRSRDLFDLYVGQRVTLTVEVTNEGGARSEAGGLEIEVPAELLAIESVTVDGEAQDVDAAGGRAPVPAIDAGQTREVRVVLRGVGYSIPTGGPARVHTRWNGGDPSTRTEYDVYDPHRWTWQGDEALLEGWRASADVAGLSAGAGLSVQPSGPAPTVESPWAPIDAASRPRLSISASRPVSGRVWWRAAGEGFDDARSAPIAAGEGRLGGGSVQQLRVQIDGEGPVVLQQLSLIEPEAEARDVPPPPPPRDAEPAVPGPDPDGEVGPVNPPPVGSGRRMDAGVGQGGDALPGTPPTRLSGRDGSLEGGCTAASGSNAAWWLLLALPGLRRRRRGR